MFRARVDWELGRSRRARTTPAVVCLDLDDFRTINDRFGRTGGDHVLVVVAQRLRAALRPSDIVARLGGDQFGVSLEDSRREDAEALAERLLAVVGAPVDVGSEVVPLSAAAGVAMSKPDDTGGALLDRALLALGAAKECGAGTCAVFGPESQPTAGHRRTPAAAALHDHVASFLLLHQATVAANESHCLEEAAEAVLRQVCTYTGWAVGLLYVVSPRDPGVLVPTGVCHIRAPERDDAFRRAAQRRSFIAGIGLPGRALASGTPEWIADITMEGGSPEADEVAAAGLRAAFALPVLVGTEVVAVLEFFAEEPAEAAGSLLELLANIGTQLGRVVERSRAREALEESQALLREAQALGRLGSWNTNLQTGEMWWSDELYEILGLERSTSPPGLEAFLAVVHPEDRELVEADIRRGPDVGEEDSSLEFRLVRPDHEFRWVVRRRSFACDDAGELVSLQMTVQDITEHKRVTQCALTCEVRWQIMLQGSQEVLSLLTEDGTIFFSLAPAGTALLTGEDASPAALVDAVHPGDAGTVRAALAELLANPDECVAFLARFGGDGEWYWHHSIATNFLDEPLIGAIVVNSQDVSRLMELEERLARIGADR